MEEFGKYRYIIDEICGGKKAVFIVPKIIPILINWAKKGETNHTYSDLTQELGYDKFTGIGNQLGYVADVIHRLHENTKKNIPTLNGLIRSKNSNLPSSGFSYVHESFNKLSESEKQRIVKSKNEEAIQYGGWNWVLDMLGLNSWQGEMTSFFPDTIDENTKFSEGLAARVLVNRYERSVEARRKCIDAKGYKCSVCGMDFEKKYGEIGKGFIHIHHITPISAIGKDYKIDYKKDLVPVCPNCHAMLHRKDPPYTIDELKKLIVLSNK